MKNIIKKCQNYKLNVEGSFAIITAVVFPVCLLILFGSLDYGKFVTSKQELKASASAAALGAVNDAQIAYVAREDIDLEKLVKDKATAVFNTRAAAVKGTEVTDFSVTASVVNNQFSVNVKYKAKVPSFVMGITGIDYYHISETQRARVSVRSYVNFNFMFDVSGSMGVGATSEDMSIMSDTIGCAFACHLGNSGRYDRARSAGATMRIDVAREAARIALNVLESRSEVPGHITVGMHTYDNRAIEIADDESRSNSNFTVLRGKLDDVQMNKTHGGTNTAGSMQKIVSNIPESGSGRTADDRIQYLIVLTDGIENSVFNNPGGNEGRPGGRGWDYYKGNAENPGHDHNAPYANVEWNQKIHAPAASTCDTAKEKDIGVFFINTEYTIPPINQQGHGSKGDWRFQYIDSTLNALTTDRLIECAGDPDSVIKASTPQQITAAFASIIGELSSPLSLY